MKETDRKIKYVKGEKKTLKEERQTYLDYKGRSVMCFPEDGEMGEREGTGVGVTVDSC